MKRWGAFLTKNNGVLDAGKNSGIDIEGARLGVNSPGARKLIC